MNSDHLGKIETVSLYGSRRQEGHIDDIRTLISGLIAGGKKVYVEKKLADAINEAGYRLAIHNIKTCTQCPDDTDVAVSVGGDGTFLRTAHWLRGREIPILGINTGHLGFLAGNSSDSITRQLEILLTGDARIEKRLVLGVECDAIPSSEWPYALNEVAFFKGAASMIDIKVDADKHYLASYRADGLIMSTPTGSTAYNLSVGGPIIEPTLKCIVLSPIAPHTLTLRPLVMSGDSRIVAKVESRAKEFRLSLDGRAYTVPCGMPVTVKSAPHSVLTVRDANENYASTLRSKLLWGS